MRRLLLSIVAIFVLVYVHGTSLAQDPVAIDDSFTTHGSIVLDTGANDAFPSGSVETGQPATGCPPKVLLTKTNKNVINPFDVVFCL